MPRPTLVCSPELGGSIAYMREHTSVGLGIILAGSTAAFAYNMSVYYFTMVGSALMVIISSNLIKVCLITTSAILDRVAAWDNWAGIIIFFLGYHLEQPDQGVPHHHVRHIG